MREHALARARRATARRWRSGGGRPALWRLVATLAAVAVAMAAAYELAPFGWRPGEYRTGIGELRVVELADHSRITLDAATRLRVQSSNDARIVQLISGQAQFSVTKDAARPFKVEAGQHVVVAVGTVFTVEYVDQEMHVAMLEGKVAVLPQRSSDAVPVEKTELTTGEELRVRRDGRSTVILDADLEAATAWREGRVIFNKESLAEAVHRLNRYSRLQIEISDPALASMQVSGVFGVGDVHTFVEALQAYLPVTVDTTDPETIRLRLRQN